MAVSRKTGDVVGYLDVQLIRKPRSPFGSHFLIISQAGAERLALMRKKLGVDGLGVLAMVLSKLSYDNAIPVSQTEIARILGMQKTHVSRAFRRLLDGEVLIEGQRFGTIRSYRLNPEFGWKGPAEAHHAALRERRKITPS